MYAKCKYLLLSLKHLIGIFRNKYDWQTSIYCVKKSCQIKIFVTVNEHLIGISIVYTDKCVQFQKLFQ